MEHLTCEIRRLNGETVAVVVLTPKTFASGSRGYHGQTKTEHDGERLQIQCQAIVIGSKTEANNQ